jgi:hypothetical protein
MPDTFTPGPWVAFPLPGGAWGIRHQSEYRSGGMHADVNNLNRHTVEARDTAEANAKLIAAAPDLLAALRAILAEAQAQKDAPLPVYAFAWDQVHAAIAKAEGGL